MIFDTDSGLHLPSTDDDLDQRVRLLSDLGLGAPDAQFDAFAAELARDANLPYAMVNLVTDQQVFVGLHGPSEDDLPAVDRTMPRDHGYCPEVIERRRALVLPDVYAHPRFSSNPVVDQIGIRTYLGSPLIHEPTGTVLGTVCALGLAERPLSTGQASLALIKARRDALMELICRRTARAPK